MKQFCLLIIAITFVMQPASAMFRFHKNRQVTSLSYTHYTAQEQLQRYQRIAAGLHYLHIARPRLRKPRLNPIDRYNVDTEGIVAFSCAMLSLVCLAALGLTSVAFFVIPAFIFAILAAVFGSVGIRRTRRGYAIAGLVLGILEIVAGFAILAIVL